MENDPRKLLLLNRISIMGDKPDLQSNDFTTHVYMSWPGFYNSVSHLSVADTLILMFSDNVAFDNSGVLLNVGSIHNLSNLNNLQGDSNDSPHSIH